MRDDNPYSRLMALQRMGVVKDYERVRSFAVAVVGVGGVGRSVVVCKSKRPRSMDRAVQIDLAAPNLFIYPQIRTLQRGRRDADPLRGGEAAAL